jgi:hypothetical protein
MTVYDIIACVACSSTDSKEARLNKNFKIRNMRAII